MSTQLPYVLVWRETPSPGARLRTYTTQDDVPLAYLLSDLSPAPTLVIATASALDEYLSSDSTTPAAIPVSLAESHLGWEPVPATTT